MAKRAGRPPSPGPPPPHSWPIRSQVDKGQDEAGHVEREENVRQVARAAGGPQLPAAQGRKHSRADVCSR